VIGQWQPRGCGREACSIDEAGKDYGACGRVTSSIMDMTEFKINKPVPWIFALFRSDEAKQDVTLNIHHH